LLRLQTKQEKWDRGEISGSFPLFGKCTYSLYKISIGQLKAIEFKDLDIFQAFGVTRQ